MEQVAPVAAAGTTDTSTLESQAVSQADTIESFQLPAQSTPALASKGAIICAICEKTPSKYKCPRCYLPYCSVVCNKIHMENHPPDPEPRPAVKTEVPEPPSNAAAAAVTPLDLANPFRALDESELLQRLFRKYPGLTQQLLDIHAATQPPQEAPGKTIPASLMQGVPRKNNWNPDIGIKNGKEALRRARRADGEAGEAIREYSELVLHLINSQDDKMKVTTMLQQQTAQEDAKLIEQLLAQER